MIPVKMHAHKAGVVMAVARVLGVTNADILCPSRERVLTRFGIAHSLRIDHHWPWDQVAETIQRERTTTYYAVETAAMLLEKGSVEQRAILGRVRETVHDYIQSLPTN